MARLSSANKLINYDYYIVSIKQFIPALNKLSNHIFKVNNFLSLISGYGEINNNQNLINFRLKH